MGTVYTATTTGFGAIEMKSKVPKEFENIMEEVVKCKLKNRKGKCRTCTVDTENVEIYVPSFEVIQEVGQKLDVYNICNTCEALCASNEELKVMTENISIRYLYLEHAAECDFLMKREGKKRKKEYEKLAKASRERAEKCADIVRSLMDT